ncbi:protein transport protein Sec16B [Clupea harengus]|uniref:Protein transport protein Sec16B n=1 Tax=Clupea harengus TaxID=7950 RepID=A0A6P8FQJ2_CLUHA|nr:protein transport protein Sec16B [Clupea harengus]XP_031430418.1 protein transport protein Sec16B [Clupea harengus]XP_031430419.1 protein transport protein Sec16B [Clupea harengus]XP_031430420.1 protein transport protein Sec16B [Clupea harengus]
MASRGDNWQYQDREAHQAHRQQQQQQQQRPRDDYPGSSHLPGPGPHPSVHTRERERPWSAVDPRYAHYPASSAPRPDQTTGHSGAYHRPDYDHPHSRPLSRQGYDQTYWDYRDSYGYYDPYHRGHYQHPGAGGWPPQDQWRTNHPPEKSYGQQGWSGPSYQDYYSYDQRGESSQYDYNQSEGNHRRTSDEYEPGALAGSKTSGLSSSSYELSQYINGAEESDSIPQSYSEPETVPQLTAPLKFTLPHAVVSFGPAGQLIRISTAFASDGERALVEFHSLEVILGDTQEQKDLRDFPGPLARPDLHKVDVITFALQMAEACLKDVKLPDAASAALLWNLLVLLCRQNGRIVGSDIAELLTRGTLRLGACEGSAGLEEEASLIDLSDRPPEEEPLDTGDLLTGNPLACPAESAEEALRHYTQLLLSGRKKEALESAMKSGLWGHALFLASKMDNRAYTTVLNRFTGCLSPSDPLQTLFQLLSKRIPTVATCCGSDRWGDWKPHLAVMLSNETEDDDTHRRAIITMGDTLASRGQLHAAHICYLTAHSPFGVYTNKAERLVLLGSSHSLPFLKFAQTSAMQCTEVFEYSQRLGNPAYAEAPFQVYKFLYACRLLDCGLAPQAFHYCEVVGKTLLTLKEPPVVLLKELIKLTDRLRHGEASLAGADEDSGEPDWLMQLRTRELGAQMKHWAAIGSYQPAGVENTVAPDENRGGSGELTDNLYGTGALSATACLPDPLSSEASGEWHPQVGAPPPVGQLMQEAPELSGYSQPIMPRLAEPEFGHEPPSQGAPQHPGLLPIQGDSYYHPPADASASLSSPPTEAQGYGLSEGPGMMSVYTNGATLGGGDLAELTQIPNHPKPETEEPASIQPSKSSKAGWFSGWFGNKAKDSEREASDVATPSTPLQEPTSSPTIFLGPPQAPIESSRPLHAPPLSAGVNPFSRRAAAGQQLGVRMTPNHGSMPQGP